MKKPVLQLTYFSNNILKKAIIYTQHLKKITVTEKDIAVALEDHGINIWSDNPPLKNCLKKRKSKSKSKSKRKSKSKSKRKRRFKPGTRALMNIRKYQKCPYLNIPRASFERVVRDIGKDYESLIYVFLPRE